MDLKQTDGNKSNTLSCAVLVLQPTWLYIYTHWVAQFEFEIELYRLKKN